MKRAAVSAVSALILALAQPAGAADGAGTAAPVPARVAGSGPVETVKETAVEVGHAVKDAAVEVGHAARETAVEAGRAAKEAAIKVGHGVKNAAVEVGHAAKNTVQEVGEGVKSAISSGPRQPPPPKQE
jgi:hypothetical protein